MSSVPVSPTYELPPETARRELLADLRSTAWTGDRERSARAWASRPGILRRVALALAALIRPETDRIVAVGAAAGSLGTAVSLTCGIPFTVASDTDARVETATRAREAVALISFFGDELVTADANGSATVQSLVLFASGSSNPSFVFDEDWTRVSEEDWTRDLTRPQHQSSSGATE